MGPGSSLGTWLVAWAVVATLILLVRARSHVTGSGLVPAFVLNFALAYWIGAAIYVLPWYSNQDLDVVATGFQETTYALIAFATGALVLAPLVTGRRNMGPTRPSADPPRPRLALAYMTVGFGAFLALSPVGAGVPTVTALVSQGWNLLIVGLGLRCWYAWRHRQSQTFVFWLAATLCLPLLTIVSQGFLGYGAAAATAVLTFLASFYRPRWRAVAFGLMLTYLGMSLYVTYLRDRVAIRSTETVSDRIQSLYSTLTSLEWFDLSNQQHLERIDVRLNHAYQVGAAVEYVRAGLAPLAYSQTLVDGVLSLVPRVIWPSKPLVAGSGDLVARYTGMTFAPGTAVGIGNVMEAYISFGTSGVVVGFLLLGTALTIIDERAARYLQRGDWFGFVRWFLPGLGLLQTESSIVATTSSVGAALVVAILANRLVRRYVRATGGKTVGTTHWPRALASDALSKPSLSNR